jgi:CO dehydrogenase/acetyl-CoA synthase beta subunit
MVPEQGATFMLPMIQLPAPATGSSGPGFKIILTNVKIHAETVTIKKIDTKKKK